MSQLSQQRDDAAIQLLQNLRQAVTRLEVIQSALQQVGEVQRMVDHFTAMGAGLPEPLMSEWRELRDRYELWSVDETGEAPWIADYFGDNW